MPTPRTPEDIVAKKAFMNAYFDDALKRVAFVERLAANGQKVESLTLCLVYLDGFSQYLRWPRREIGRNFVETLCSNDRIGFLSRIHLLQLMRAFNEMKGSWPPRAKILRRLWPGPTYSLMSRIEASNAITESFSSKKVAEILSELWRGTVAAAAYDWMRNRSVHGFGTAQYITFDMTRYKGKAIPPLGLESLLRPLRAMITELRRRSLERCEWFGDDRIIQGDDGSGDIV